jgi:hypothetical protein
MTESTNATAAAETPAPKTFVQKITPAFMTVCAVIIAIGGAIKIYKFISPSLPDCTASETTDVIRNIMKEKNVVLNDLSGMTSLNETPTEKTCQAHIDTPIETGTILYKVSWEGKSAQVMITKVDVKNK